MLTTEKEAQGKICHVARGTRMLCIASACMAWRDARLVRTDSEEPVGYCGLAGQPSEELLEAEVAGETERQEMVEAFATALGG